MWGFNEFLIKATGANAPHFPSADIDQIKAKCCTLSRTEVLPHIYTRHASIHEAYTHELRRTTCRFAHNIFIERDTLRKSISSAICGRALDVRPSGAWERARYLPSSQHFHAGKSVRTPHTHTHTHADMCTEKTPRRIDAHTSNTHLKKSAARTRTVVAHAWSACVGVCHCEHFTRVREWARFKAVARACDTYVSARALYDWIVCSRVMRLSLLRAFWWLGGNMKNLHSNVLSEIFSSFQSNKSYYTASNFWGSLHSSSLCSGVFMQGISQIWQYSAECFNNVWWNVPQQWTCLHIGL